MSSNETSKNTSPVQRIVIVGASLAGLSAAEALRCGGICRDANCDRRRAVCSV